jgi:hypothetical protein
MNVDQYFTIPTLISGCLGFAILIVLRTIRSGLGLIFGEIGRVDLFDDGAHRISLDVVELAAVDLCEIRGSFARRPPCVVPNMTSAKRFSAVSEQFVCVHDDRHLGPAKQIDESIENFWISREVRHPIDSQRLFFARNDQQETRYGVVDDVAEAVKTVVSDKIRYCDSVVVELPDEPGGTTPW